MFTHHGPASPSVTLEQGITRLRPARPKPQLQSVREDGQHGIPFPTGADRRAAAVLAYIAFAILLAVCIMLFLLSRSSSMPELVPLLTPLPAHPRSAVHAAVPATPLQHASEQFLSYLPHSGFHNQRIALENALVLAYILNRTLLIPPVTLGSPPIPYRPFESLRIDLALSSRIGLEHCLNIHEDDMTPMPEECKDFWTSAQLPWDWFIDLTPVTTRHGIRVLSRPDVTDRSLTRLGLTPADTFFVNDTKLYQFRLFDLDLADDATPVGLRYSTRISLPALAASAHTYRLLQFGSLFGTSRLRLAYPVHATVQRDVRRAMVFSNPALLAQADAIRDSAALRGMWGYVAVHLRLNSRVFAQENTSVQNVRHVWWKLVRTLGVNDDDAMELEGRACKMQSPREQAPPQSGNISALSGPHPSLIPRPLSSSCREAIHPLLHLPLYIATDAPEHPALAVFANTFPCIYLLSNFSDLLTPLRLSQAAIPPTTGTTLPPASVRSYAPPARFLEPFLDALIASKARVVVGTPGSTFSTFVEGALWRHYHEWDMVERGR